MLVIIIEYFLMLMVVEKMPWFKSSNIGEYHLIKTQSKTHLFSRHLQSRKVWVWINKNLSASCVHITFLQHQFGCLYTNIFLHSVRLADTTCKFLFQGDHPTDTTQPRTFHHPNSVTAQWISNLSQATHSFLSSRLWELNEMNKLFFNIIQLKKDFEKYAKKSEIS